MGKFYTKKKSDNNAHHEAVSEEVNMMQTLLDDIKNHKKDIDNKLKDFNSSKSKEDGDLEKFIIGFAEIKEKLDEVMVKIDPELVKEVQQLDENSANLLDISLSHLGKKKLTMKEGIKKIVS
jgi:hypothetical protein